MHHITWLPCFSLPSHTQLMSFRSVEQFHIFILSPCCERAGRGLWCCVRPLHPYSMSLYDWPTHYFWALRMYCIYTEALVLMFNGGSSYGFTIYPIFTRICMLYPGGYLCSTSLMPTHHVNKAYQLPPMQCCFIAIYVFVAHWWRDLFMCDTVHIRSYNVKSHWKVEGRNSTPE